MEKLLARLNGQTMPLSEVRISPLDRGFLFGDAVYEVLRVYSGKPFLLEAHMARLRRSLDCLRISGVDVDEVQREGLELLAASGEKEATLYIQISRGMASSRAHVFPTDPIRPTVFLFVAPFKDPNRDLRRTGAAAITQLDNRWGRVDIKTVNLLGNVLALQAAKESSALEAILISAGGEVTEGTHTNVFAVVDETLRTKPLSHEVLPGISRDVVVELAKGMKIPYQERAISAAELKRATEIFITATTTEVMPIVKVDGKAIGGGVPGPITCKIRDAFSETIERFRK